MYLQTQLLKKEKTVKSTNLLIQTTEGTTYFESEAWKRFVLVVEFFFGNYKYHIICIIIYHLDRIRNYRVLRPGSKSDGRKGTGYIGLSHDGRLLLVFENKLSQQKKW